MTLPDRILAAVRGGAFTRRRVREALAALPAADVDLEVCRLLYAGRLATQGRRLAVPEGAP